MNKKPETARIDIYAKITDRIIADLERGVRPWVQPWHADHAGGRITKPLRHNGEPYSGINVILLWSEAVAKGFSSATWMTFKQAIELGGHVRKGETGSTVVYANTFTRTETDGTGQEVEQAIPFLKAYTVFCVDQIDGLSDRYFAKPKELTDPVKRIAHADAFFAATGAVIRHGGSQAYYVPSKDVIQMPPFETFEDAESHAAKLAHEIVHNAYTRIMPEHIVPSRKQRPPARRCRHNQRDSRNASNLSSGRYRPGLAAGAVILASAFSLSRRSA
jgi:antirestriction protein ArdC